MLFPTEPGRSELCLPLSWCRKAGDQASRALQEEAISCITVTLLVAQAFNMSAAQDCIFSQNPVIIGALTRFCFYILK